MKYTYLLINLACVFFPLVLSFDKKVHFFSKWKFAFPAIGITGLVFLIWDLLFTKLSVWSFNPDYIIGVGLMGLPLEEMLFFLTVPYACMFIYACLEAYFPITRKDRFSLPLSNIILGLCIAMIFFGYSRWYTLINFAFLFVVLFFVEYVNQSVRFMAGFYRAFLVSLIPFYIVNGYLTAAPVVLYNPAERSGMQVGTIPFEDHFYLMSLLLMNIYLYEIFKKKATRHAS